MTAAISWHPEKIQVVDEDADAGIVSVSADSVLYDGAYLPFFVRGGVEYHFFGMDHTAKGRVLYAISEAPEEWSK
jgi:hypothetical protein